MFDIPGILKNALSGSLRDLESMYGRLSELDSSARKQIVDSAAALLDSFNSAVAEPQTSTARWILLDFQYLVHFKNNLDRFRAFEFILRLQSCCPRTRYDYHSWYTKYPSLPEFRKVVSNEFPEASLSRQVEILCGEDAGIRFPVESQDFDTWANDSKLAFTWTGSYYVDSLERERRRWFPSAKKIADLERFQQADIEEKAWCKEAFQQLFAHLLTSRALITNLALRESALFEAQYVAKIAKAVEQGIPLKYLLLEEAAELDQILGAMTRGL